MTRAIAALGLVLGLGAMTPDPALACSCMAMTPCQALSRGGRSPNVFAATVISVELYRPEHPVVNGVRRVEPGTITVRLKDVEPLLGESADVVTTIGMGPSCGYTFKVGERYVIDAGSSREGLSTSLCSQTRPIAQAGPLLDYIASLKGPSPGATVTGTVTMRNMSMLDMSGLDAALAGLRVTAEGVTTHSTTTRADGSFSFAPLPPGTYSLRLDLRDAGPFTQAREHRFTLAGSHACHDAYLALNLESSVAGTVIDRDGRPVAKARMALRAEVAVAERGGTRFAWAESDEFGQYRFTGIPPGRYVVGLNVDRGPMPDSNYVPVFVGDASSQRQVVDFPLGGHVELAPLVAVPTTNVTVGGRVAWPDGRPGRGIRIRARSHGESGRYGGATVEAAADDEGRFQLDLAAGVHYTITAFPAPGVPTAERESDATSEIETLAGSGPVDLVLRRRR